MNANEAKPIDVTGLSDVPSGDTLAGGEESQGKLSPGRGSLVGKLALETPPSPLWIVCVWCKGR